jgi:hypothetical protein
MAYRGCRDLGHPLAWHTYFRLGAGRGAAGVGELVSHSAWMLGVVVFGSLAAALADPRPTEGRRPPKTAESGRPLARAQPHERRPGAWSVAALQQPARPMGSLAGAWLVSKQRRLEEAHEAHARHNLWVSGFGDC